MASDKQTYTPEFKVKIAKEALNQSKKDLDGLAKKYDVPVSAILTWTTKYEKQGAGAFEAESKSLSGEPRIKDQESVDVEVEDPDVAESISFGVMHDDLNYKRLIFWSVAGIILVLIFVQGLIEMYQYSTDVTKERISEGSEFYEVNQMKREAEETLSSFGVVDPEEGIYRIPIDSAMNDIVNESNAN